MEGRSVLRSLRTVELAMRGILLLLSSCAAASAVRLWWPARSADRLPARPLLEFLCPLLLYRLDVGAGRDGPGLTLPVRWPEELPPLVALMSNTPNTVGLSAAFGWPFRNRRGKVRGASRAAAPPLLLRATGLLEGRPSPPPWPC